MREWSRAFVVIGVLAAGCGGATLVPSPVVTLSGTWSGVLGQGSGGGRALRITWTATQDGSTASGPVSVLTSPPTTDIAFSGVLTARISGSDVSLTLLAQPLAGSECSLSSAGSAGVSNSTLSGSLDVHFTSCGGLEPPSSNQLTLTRQ